MGSQASKEYSTDQSIPQKKGQNIKQVDLAITSLGNLYNDNSSYEGAIEQTKIKNKNVNRELTFQDNSNSDKSKNKIKFIWKEGGNDVYITGTFCDWKEQFQMIKNENNFFEKKLNIPKGKYEFKFIVDRVWKCSTYYPQKQDVRGINNNYIDTDLINQINDEILGNTSNNFNKIQKGNLDELKRNYNNIYPYKEQLNPDAPKIPDVFEVLMDLDDNTNQKYIGNKQFLDYPFINLDESFKNIIQPFHAYLNHLFTSKVHFIKNNDDSQNLIFRNKKINYIGINCNIKIKNKCISIVYYSPLNKM